MRGCGAYGKWVREAKAISPRYIINIRLGAFNNWRYVHAKHIGRLKRRKPSLI